MSGQLGDSLEERLRAMDRLTLKMKLFVGFGTLLAILVVSVVAGLRTVGELDEAANLVGRKVQEKELTLALTGSVLKESTGTQAFLMTGKEQALDRVNRGRSDYRQITEKLTPLVHSEEGKRLFAEMGRTHDALQAVLDHDPPHPPDASQ